MAGNDRLLQGVVENIFDISSLSLLLKTARGLEQYFPGREASGGRDHMLYKSFKTYTELAEEAMMQFRGLVFEYGGFGGGSYEQLFSSVRLGLYSAVDNCVLSRGGLNYPEAGRDKSPRLEAVQKYLREVYFWRVRLQILDIFIRLDLFPKDAPSHNISKGQ